MGGDASPSSTANVPPIASQSAWHAALPIRPDTQHLRVQGEQRGRDPASLDPLNRQDGFVNPVPRSLAFQPSRSEYLRAPFEASHTQARFRRGETGHVMDPNLVWAPGSAHHIPPEQARDWQSIRSVWAPASSRFAIPAPAVDDMMQRAPGFAPASYANPPPGPLLPSGSLNSIVPEFTMGPHYHGDPSVHNAPGHHRPPPSQTQRHPSNRDEFDGPTEWLPRPQGAALLEPREADIPQLPMNLTSEEQDQILTSVSQRLSRCAFDFVARYQFPIPIEPDKRRVRVPNDREWAEWVYLIKRLATKRRIPTRVVYDGQIKQLATVLESTVDMRPRSRHQSAPLKDDRYILQLISAGLQVAKILKDADAMHDLDRQYVEAEWTIRARVQAQQPGPSTYADYYVSDT